MKRLEKTHAVLPEHQALGEVFVYIMPYIFNKYLECPAYHKS